jgi:DhnA family fructose-bisphosphate aldolase class Ia
MALYIPADVPRARQRVFKKNCERITRGSDSLFLFAADQKIEHLNDDFSGAIFEGQARTAEYIFSLAAQAPIGALATQLGLIARYGASHQTVNYIVKLNSKTNLSAEQEDPVSRQLWSVADVVQFQQTSRLSLCGVGYTIYLGSLHEALMLQEAANIVYQAHQNGLVAILWIYPRGKYVELSARSVIGAAGVANALGADFVKLQRFSGMTNHDIVHAVQAAGNTKVLFAGGAKSSDDILLAQIKTDFTCGVFGCAVGRNLFQRPLKQAIALAERIAVLLR